MASKDLEKAVRAAQLYHGSMGSTDIRTQQKLYTRMQRAVESVAKKRGLDTFAVGIEVSAEAVRRGHIRPIPGKDI